MSDPSGEGKGKEIVAAELRERLSAVSLDGTRDLSAVATTAVTLAMTQPEPEEKGAGRDCFYPDMDADVQALLSELGAEGLLVLTVPSNVNMQSGNTALALATGGQVKLYQNMLANMAEDFDGVDPDAVRERVCVGMMLLKDSLSGLQRDGNVIHEAGHIVLGQKAETGEVFAYEITTIAKKYGAAAAAEWVKNRPIAYYAQKVNGRVEALDKVMHELDPEVADLWAKERGKVVKNKADAKTATQQEKKPSRFRVFEVGESITGTLAELRTQVGVDAAESRIPTTATRGDKVVFGRISWTLEDLQPGTDGDAVYTLKRMKETDAGTN